MTIMAQSGKWIADWNKVKKVFCTKGSVNAGFEDGDVLVCGTYKTEQQCMTAMGRLYYALAAGDSSFEFPQPDELPDSKAHYGTGGGRRHGRS